MLTLQMRVTSHGFEEHIPRPMLPSFARALPIDPW